VYPLDHPNDLGRQVRQSLRNLYVLYFLHSYWLRRLGLVQTRMDAEVSRREDTSKATAPSSTEQGSLLAAAAARGARKKRSARRTSRRMHANCLSPRTPGAGECSSARYGGDDPKQLDSALLASQARRGHLMAQLTGEERDALFMREVLMQGRRQARDPSALSVHSDGGSLDYCGSALSPSVGSASSRFAAGVSGVVSVSSRAQSDNGLDACSYASGSAASHASSWSLLSATLSGLQLEPLAGAATGLGAPQAAETERYRTVLLMSDGESADS
jgi:hypothetical protein